MADTTVTARQNKRLERMAHLNVGRTTVKVHDRCKGALDALRPHFASPLGADALNKAVLDLAATKPVNVAQVSQLSPFRYPGGKTWLVPEVRSWVHSLPYRPSHFIEPFAGGGIVGLTIGAEHLADAVIMSELDDDVAAVWTTLISGEAADVTWLCETILSFDMTLENVMNALAAPGLGTKEHAFQTILRNRVQRGGIMASGAGLMSAGENGKGLKSRWYPETLVKRISAIFQVRPRFCFYQKDAFEVIAENAELNAAWFVDPPYTAGGKKAGSRLYNHPDIDHELLFKMIGQVKGAAMLTYDDNPEVERLALAHGFTVCRVPMKSSHHKVMEELLILKAAR